MVVEDVSFEVTGLSATAGTNYVHTEDVPDGETWFVEQMRITFNNVSATNSGIRLQFYHDSQSTSEVTTANWEYIELNPSNFDAVRVADINHYVTGEFKIALQREDNSATSGTLDVVVVARRVL